MDRAPEDDPALVAERLRREARKEAGLFGAGRRDARRRATMTRALRLSGLAGPGRRNALDVRLTRHALRLDGLPDALDGLAVLQLGDPHWRETRDEAHERGLLELVRATPHELLVLTGDYRDRSFGAFDGALAALARLRAATGAPAIAVLGNHDSIRMVEPMRRLGIEVLVNAHAHVRFDARGGRFRGAELAVAGVDDPAYYRLHDARAATRGIAPGTPTLLLAHSPAVADAVARDCPAVHACLSGHTHGGQIRLPGGVPLARHLGVPGDTLAGPWSRPRAGGGTLHGYTPLGCGTSILDARFFCPPELVLHELRRAGEPDAGGATGASA